MVIPRPSPATAIEQLAYGICALPEYVAILWTAMETTIQERRAENSHLLYLPYLLPNIPLTAETS